MEAEVINLIAFLRGNGTWNPRAFNFYNLLPAWPELIIKFFIKFIKV